MSIKHPVRVTLTGCLFLIPPMCGIPSTIDRLSTTFHTLLILIAPCVGNGTTPLAMDARDGLGN